MSWKNLSIKPTKIDAILCKQCNTVLYSVHRHHMSRCSCPNDAFIDGGREYSIYGAMKLKKTQRVTLYLYLPVSAEGENE